MALFSGSLPAKQPHPECVCPIKYPVAVDDMTCKSDFRVGLMSRFQGGEGEYYLAADLLLHPVSRLCHNLLIQPQRQAFALQWRHNGCDNVSNHQPSDCLLNRLFRHRSQKTSKLRVTGLCARNSPGTGEFPAQMASHAENVFIWWRHHALDNGGSSSSKFIFQKCTIKDHQTKIYIITCTHGTRWYIAGVRRETQAHRAGNRYP